jgi:hypothetical protein
MAASVARSRARASSTPRKAKSRRKLLEWGVVFPILLGSLLTAGPQWIDSVRAMTQGINSGTVKQAKQQAALWRKNLSCAAAPYSWFNSPGDIKVDATICDSGDIFVRASTPGNQQYFKWLPLSDVVQGDEAGGGGLIPEANAATLATRPPAAPLSPAVPGVRLAQPVANVVCQKFLDDRRLLRRVKTPQGCFEEVIDTFNGQVVSRKAVPCTPQC